MANWDKGIIHGDLKPQNILVYLDKNDSRHYISKVANFGYSALIVKKK
jgi:serine/threonine protein kinase